MTTLATIFEPTASTAAAGRTCFKERPAAQQMADPLTYPRSQKKKGAAAMQTMPTPATGRAEPDSPPATSDIPRREANTSPSELGTAIAVVINAILVGLAPGAILILALGAIDYLASRLFYLSHYEDPVAFEIEKQHVDDFRAKDFTPYSHFSTEVYGSADLGELWPRLDPVVRTRIWLRSLYPVTRPADDTTESDTSRIIESLGLKDRYINTSNPVEFYSRAVSSGRPSDVIAFLNLHQKCVASGQCKISLVREQIAALLYASHVTPAAQLIRKGQCSRARSLLSKASEIMNALDLSRADDSSVYNAVRTLQMIAEHGSCATDYSLIAPHIEEPSSIVEEPIIQPNLAAFPQAFAELRNYGSALKQFNTGDYVSALAEFERIRMSSKGTLSELSAFMGIRCIFWSIVHHQRNDLWENKAIREDFFEEASLRPIRGSPKQLQEKIGELKDSIRSRSLQSDIDQYHRELALYGVTP